jgi:hypothetical protein
MIPFPLPPEHRFGRTRHELVHDGSASHQEAMWLRAWQARVRQLFPSERLQPSGFIDGTTVRIAVAMQERAGIPATGLIDEETWYLAWAE